MDAAGPQAEAPASPAPPPAPAGSAPATQPPAAEAPPESEIKQVTALCCELAPPSAAPLESELRHTALTRLLELGQAELSRYGGHVNQTLRHGFLALVGAPVAHEDHLERAVLAAFGIRRRLAQAMEDVNAAPGESWAVRMGLETGPVVVGGVGEVAVGESTDAAQRLAELAEPGTVLVGEGTHKALGSGADLTAVEGLPDAVEAWSLAGPPTGPAQGAEQSRTPFVGRQRDLGELEELLFQAESGHGQVVSLVGEAGSGKSRLGYEFRRTLGDRPMSVLRGRCLSYGGGVPYLPFVEMIRRTTGIRDTDTSEEVAAKLRSSVGTDPEASLPYLLSLLGHSAGIAGLGDAEPQAVQAGIFGSMRRMILDASRRSLVFLEVEDLHWVDRTSEDFLASLIEAMPAARVLLLATYRTGYQPPWLDRSYLTQINVRPLSDSDSQVLVSNILEAAGRDEPASDLLTRAGGNPFFLEELAFSLAQGEADGDSVPGTLQGVLMARLDRLPRSHKQLLQTASVLEREISLEMLSELWEGAEAAEPLIEDLLHREFLVKAPDEDEPVYLFRHALARDVAYQSLLARRRSELHARAAAVLERLYEDRLEEVYDRLVYHYPRADKPEQTVHYFVLFAAQAAGRYSHSEAAGALREALSHAKQLPEEVRDRRLAEVLLRLADSLLPLAGFAETLELFEQHRQSVESLGDSSITAQYQFWLAHTHTYLGNHEPTKTHAAAAITAAQEVGDEATEGKARYVLGREGFWSGQFETGVENSLRAVVLLERSGEAWWEGQAYWVGGFNHFALGQFDAALEALERARDIGDALADYRLDTSWSIGFMLTTLGRHDEGLEQCRRGVENAKDPLNGAVATGFLGHAQMSLGELPRAVESLETSLRSLEEAGMHQLKAWFASYLAEAYLMGGKAGKALEVAEGGLTAADRVNFGYGAALARRTLGRIHRAEDRKDEAATEFRGALDLFDDLQMPFEVACTRLDLARLASDRGVQERELRAAREAFSALQLDLQIAEVERLAGELASSAEAD